LRPSLFSFWQSGNSRRLALLVVWAYQQKQLFFWKRAVFFARKREFLLLVVFPPRLFGVFLCFLVVFLCFLGVFFCAFGVFLFFARQRDIFLGR